jgi:hypothetical protein
MFVMNDKSSRLIKMINMFVKMMNTFVNMTNLRLSSGDEADESIFAGHFDEITFFSAVLI